jgi:TolB-like protein/Tfp pilus assembly protein PilF
VVRVGGAYLVAAWVLAQVAEYATDVFGAPDWVLKTFTVFLLLGLPVALILAWVFEMTSEGIRRDPGAAAADATVTPARRKLDFAIIGVLAVVVLVLAVERFTNREATEPAPQATVTAAAASGLTIAVLPFTNMSSDEENEHFADGLTEELLNVLAKIQGLQVAGRTSSFHFKGKNEDLRLIGDQLGVAHILEGSVRKSGDAVRITAQLIKAEDGFHLWSETYDRRLDDIFAIQDDIAGAVATALRAQLLGEEDSVVKAQSEIDPEVYARFIAAKSRITSKSDEDLVSAHEALEAVVREAPDYAPAHAALAIAALSRWRYSRTISAEDARAIAKTATERALALAPDDDYVQTAYGVYLSELVENANEAGLRRVNDVFRRALALNPDNVEAMYFLAFNLRYLEEYDETLRLLDRALRIDPLDVAVRDLRSWALMENGRIDEAIQFAQQTSELFPDLYPFYRRAAQAETARGRPDRALAWLYAEERSAGDVGPFTRMQMLTLARQLDYEEGAREAREALGDAGSVYVQLLHYQDAREYGKALETIKAAIERDGWAEWEVELFFAAVMAGRCEDAFESNFAARLLREWSEGEPRVDSTNDNRATWTAYCLRQNGEAQQADKLLRATLAYAEPREGRFDGAILRHRRIAALAMLGERERAIEEFQAYYDAGFGSLPFIPYDHDPRYADVVDDPRFREILDAIESRNARRLERMIATDFAVDTST